MATKLTASGSNLLVKMIDPKEMKTKGGLVLPAGPRRGETCYGEVKSLGTEVPDLWRGCVGTIVVFERSRCYEVDGGTATLAFLPAADVLGTVEFDDAPEIILPSGRA